MSYLVEVDDGLPELVLELVEVSHTNLAEVTWMVLVEVGTVVVLTTSHTTTTGMLAVLANTAVTGRDMTTAGGVLLAVNLPYKSECDVLLAGLGVSGRHCGGGLTVAMQVMSLMESAKIAKPARRCVEEGTGVLGIVCTD